MKTLVSKLALAAVLASSIPAAASARDCDHRDERPPAHAPPAVYVPVHRGPAPAPSHWREARWRERELAKLRGEFRALEDERARFHAVNAGRPGKIRRFERWYAVRRAELEARWNELQLVAWR